MKKMNLASTFALFLLLQWGCGQSEDCNWEEVSPVALPEEVSARLNGVFSEENRLVANIAGDTAVFIIRDAKDFLNVCSDRETASQIDFGRNSIVWGRVLTSSVSDRIARTQLSGCSVSSRYLYDVTVGKCTDCWAALGYHYFWNVYSRKIKDKDIVLTVKEQPAP